MPYIIAPVTCPGIGGGRFGWVSKLLVKFARLFFSYSSPAIFDVVVGFFTIRTDGSVDERLGLSIV